ncbi:MAG: pilus assembly protein PilP [Deltaproteobacteria bacterium]|jgi:hypothetical protein|nr:pilus assembly protein PilP [Deltaproteobacteria bacterium]
MSKSVGIYALAFIFFIALFLIPHTDVFAQNVQVPGSPLVIPPVKPADPAIGQPENTNPPKITSFSDEVFDNDGKVDPSNLEKYPIKDLSLSAIVVKNDPDNNIALLEVGGIGYSVQKGAKVGSDNGIIREITESNVIIEQIGKDGEPTGKTFTLGFSK